MNTKIQAYKGKVIVTDLDKGEQVLKSGIIISDDNLKTSGVHPRWGKVYSVGEGVDDIKEGEYILIDTGRWTKTINIDGLELNMVDYPKGVLVVSPTKPDYFGYGN